MPGHEPHSIAGEHSRASEARRVGGKFRDSIDPPDVLGVVHMRNAAADPIVSDSNRGGERFRPGLDAGGNETRCGKGRGLEFGLDHSVASSEPGS